MLKHTLITTTAIFITGLLIIPYAQAKHLYKEADYQQAWCKAHNGQTEVILDDSTRVDCIIDTHAIEFDFAPKWAESVGQSLYYSLKTNKKAGIVLIMENLDKDQYYLQRVVRLAKKHNIDVWTMKDLQDFESIAYKRRGLLRK